MFFRFSDRISPAWYPVLCLLLVMPAAAQDASIIHEADILHEPASSPAVMVKGRASDDLYWLAGATGDDPRIFAMRADGSSVIPTFSKFS